MLSTPTLLTTMFASSLLTAERLPVQLLLLSGILRFFSGCQCFVPGFSPKSVRFRKLPGVVRRGGFRSVGLFEPWQAALSQQFDNRSDLLVQIILTLVVTPPFVDWLRKKQAEPLSQIEMTCGDARTKQRSPITEPIVLRIVQTQLDGELTSQSTRGFSDLEPDKMINVFR